MTTTTTTQQLNLPTLTKTASSSSAAADDIVALKSGIIYHPVLHHRDSSSSSQPQQQLIRNRILAAHSPGLWDRIVLQAPIGPPSSVAAALPHDQHAPRAAPDRRRTQASHRAERDGQDPDHRSGRRHLRPPHDELHPIAELRQDLVRLRPASALLHRRYRSGQRPRRVVRGEEGRGADIPRQRFHNGFGRSEGEDSRGIRSCGAGCRFGTSLPSTRGRWGAIGHPIRDGGIG